MSYGISGRLAHVVVDDPQDGAAAVFLMPLPDGPPKLLEGSAALIWIIAADGEADVVGAVAEVVGRPTVEIVDDVRSFLDHLVDTGLLQGAGDP